MSLLVLKNLNFSYKKNKDAAIKSLSFRVPENKRVALLGPNGSGKSTAFKIISTQVEGWSGEVIFDGLNLHREQTKIRAKLGVCFQSPSLDRILTGRENLILQARVLGLNIELARTEISYLAEKLKVNYLDQPIGEVSGGQARRVEIIKAFLGHPKMLLLDEPTNGLDPQARRDFWSAVTSLSAEKGATVLVTTHLIEEAELCDELIFMSEGTCVAQGSPKSLRTSLGFEILQIEIADPSNHAIVLKSKLKAGEKVEVFNEVIRVSTPRAESLFDEIRSEWKSDIRRIEWAKPTLADVYFEKTGKALQ